MIDFIEKSKKEDISSHLKSYNCNLKNTVYKLMLIYSLYTLFDVFKDFVQENRIGVNKSSLQTVFILNFQTGDCGTSKGIIPCIIIKLKPILINIFADISEISNFPGGN